MDYKQTLCGLSNMQSKKKFNIKENDDQHRIQNTEMNVGRAKIVENSTR